MLILLHDSTARLGTMLSGMDAGGLLFEFSMHRVLLASGDFRVYSIPY